VAEVDASSDASCLLSVGIDIGSTTSHLVFSELIVGHSNLLPGARMTVLGRRIIHRSHIRLTPFQEGLLDASALRLFVDESYRAAGLVPAAVDTGAVILTGQAARQQNAKLVDELLSAHAGKFVCATAGHHLEAKLAAHGSGAVRRSRERGETILNVDVGGGTTKLTVIRKGQVERTAAIDIGARVVRFDEDGRVAALQPSAKAVFDAAGLVLQPGEVLGGTRRRELGNALADALVQLLSESNSTWPSSLWLTEPVPELEGIDCAMLSGGVAEYAFGREYHDYGDLGAELGPAFQQAFESAFPDISLLSPEEGIRATVIGASQFSVSLSGDTIFLPDGVPLPVHNLAVVAVALPEDYDAETVAGRVQSALCGVDREVLSRGYALALSGPQFRGYSVVEALVQGIMAGLRGLPAGRLPRALVFNRNLGQVVGQFLARHWPDQLFVCIDEIEVRDLDYLDIGAVRPGESYVPVVIKSLVL
jgi:ethanolamine utilization protein EutA